VFSFAPVRHGALINRNSGGAVSFDATWTFFINSTDQTSGGSRP
jgi:hypothetical protein